MKTLVTAALALALLAPQPALAGPSAHRAPAARESGHVRLDGVDVRLRDGTRQVVTANRTRGYHARITWWVKGRDGWHKQMRAADGRIGYGGLVAGARRHQGTGTTPLGTYGLLSVFGTHPRRDAGALDYRRIRRGDHWVQDNASPHYNRYRNQRQGGFRWWLPSSDPNSSERLTDYRRPYEWSIVTGFNVEQVRHRGSGIFLHVNGRGATAGCVSAPRRFLGALVRRLDPAAAPVIAIGR